MLVYIELMNFVLMDQSTLNLTRGCGSVKNR